MVLCKTLIILLNGYCFIDFHKCFSLFNFKTILSVFFTLSLKDKVLFMLFVKRLLYIPKYYMVFMKTVMFSHDFVRPQCFHKRLSAFILLTWNVIEFCWQSCKNFSILTDLNKESDLFTHLLQNPEFVCCSVKTSSVFTKRYDFPQHFINIPHFCVCFA